MESIESEDVALFWATGARKHASKKRNDADKANETHKETENNQQERRRTRSKVNNDDKEQQQSNDNDPHENSSAKDCDGDAGSCSSSGSESDGDKADAVLQTILAEFPEIETVNDAQKLAEYLFAYQGKYLSIVVKCDDPRDDTVMLIASQLLHIPGSFAVLCDNKELWSEFLDLGARSVVACEDVKRACESLITARGVEKDRKEQLKVTLGLTKMATSKDVEVESELVVDKNDPGDKVADGDRNSTSPNTGGSETKRRRTGSIARQDLRCKLNLHKEFPKLWNIYKPDFRITDERLLELKHSLWSWRFDAHKYTMDELVVIAFYCLKSIMDRDEMQHVRVCDEILMSFLLIVRNKYDSRNTYHNFRHAVDVMQVVFYFLVSIGLITHEDDGAELNGDPASAPTSKQSTAEHTDIYFSSEDTLVLLVGALGHDLGHPGVTNSFLVQCGAPLASAYEERSVLESYHLAMLVVILNNIWPSLVESERSQRLLHDVILSTDMAVHFEYMKKASECQKENTPQDEYRRLVACMMLKCADVSNVARDLEISREWASMLVDEFDDLGKLEVELGMRKHTELSVSNREEVLNRGQKVFIETYALPLFCTMSKMVPELEFTIKQIRKNEKVWLQLGNSLEVKE